MQKSGAVQLACRWVLIGPFLRWWDKPKVVGAEHIPQHGPAILAANHLAVRDSLHIALAARRDVAFLAKSDYFAATNLRGYLTRGFMRATGQIAVDRRGGPYATAAVTAASAAIADGRLWAVHPEGSRSPDGRLYRGRTGVVRVAMMCVVPIIPVAITGTQHRRGRVTLTVLAPFDVCGYPDDHIGVREATDELMRRIGQASSQDAVDDYCRRWAQDA